MSLYGIAVTLEYVVMVVSNYHRKFLMTVILPMELGILPASAAKF